MKPKKPAPIFELVFEGNNVVPETIPLGTLTQALSAIRRLASGTPSPDEETEEADLDSELKEGSIQLLDVIRGSACYRFVCPHNAGAIDLLRNAGRMLNKPEEIGDNDYILSPIKRLSATAERMNCHIILRESAKEDGILARIEPLSYKKMTERIFISGETSFTGKVERVGGATSMKCALRVSFQPRMLFCSVENGDTSRRLGKLLYRHVAVTGQAKWIRNTWKVVAFKIKGVTKLHKKPLTDAFEELRNAGGNGWDNVDNPKKRLEEVLGK